MQLDSQKLHIDTLERKLAILEKYKKYYPGWEKEIMDTLQLFPSTDDMKKNNRVCLDESEEDESHVNLELSPPDTHRVTNILQDEDIEEIGSICSSLISPTHDK